MFGTCAVLRLIGLERRSQVRGGRTVKYDAAVNGRGQLAEAAAAMLLTAPPKNASELTLEICKANAHRARLEQLVLAAALIVAEIERINYCEHTPPSTRKQTAGKCLTAALPNETLRSAAERGGARRSAAERIYGDCI